MYKMIIENIDLCGEELGEVYKINSDSIRETVVDKVIGQS